MLSGIDVVIIVVYLLSITFIGLLFSKKAAGSIDEYFLGGRSIPWFLLGISGMATFIDIGGTAYQCAWFFLLGAKGFWFCIEGAVALLLAFQMIYVGKWLNRSKAMTNAEWMVLRFGRGRQGELARVFSVISALVICVGMMTFFFEGAGKVLPRFLPFLEGNENLAALAFFCLVGLYTVASGFYGVIYTDLMQAFLIMFLILFIAVKAMAIGTPDYFAAHAPDGWLQLFPADGHWSFEIPERYAEIASYVEKAKFLGILVIFWLINNVFMGMATPFDAWTAQRYYAARNEREGSLVACEWISLWSLRFLLMAGIGILALGVSDQIVHPEKALSVVITELLPDGVRGLLLAALLAAGMSTIDSTVNSSAAYFVKDIYQEFIRPTASKRHLVKISYAITVILFGLGIIIGWFVKDISSVWGWIIMGLFTGTLPPNILKWFWWRTNGMGFALGMGFGVFAALLTKVPFLGELNTYQTYIFVFGISTVGSILGICIGKPTDMDTLVNFYELTRPFGFWGKVRKHCSDSVIVESRKEHHRDILLIGPACLWQLSLFLMMTSLVLKQWKYFSSCLVIAGGLSLVLYKFWYKNLKKE